jgi:hypothetical protein
MDSFLFAAPVPGPVEFSVGSGLAFAVMVAIALAPVALAVREALGLAMAARDAPQLRAIEGGKELSRHAA